MYNLSLNQFAYVKLYSPIIMCSSSKMSNSNVENICYNLLVDVGTYFVHVDFSSSFPTGNIEVQRRYLSKKNLPQEKLLKFFDSLMVKMHGNEQRGHIMQFESQVYVHGMLNLDQFQKLHIRAEEYNIIHCKDQALFLFWPKGGRRIKFLISPFDIWDKLAEKVMYTFQESILSVNWVQGENYKENRYYVCDENYFLKKFDWITTENKDEFELVTEYYVNKDFSKPTSSFVIRNNILYDKF